MDLLLGSEQRLLQRINPGMVQSLNILQMNIVDLRDFVIGECEKNPAVEFVERRNSPHARGDAIFNATAEQTMDEYILSQVPEWPEENKTILLSLLQNLDEKGFFAGNVDSIAAEHCALPETVEGVLSELKTLRPYGIGAKNLPEALLIEIRSIPGIGAAIKSKAEQIVERYSDDLLRGSLKKIAKLSNIALGDVMSVAKLVSRLRFAPLSFFRSDTSPEIIPDIKFFRRNGEWIVDVDDAHCPQLKFSAAYKGLLAGNPDQETVKYLKKQAKRVRLLTEAISKRKATLHRVAQSILEHQMQFFEFGPKWLKRLSMREVAEDISVSISTVSRSVAGKYAETPHGTFALSEFFESGVNDCSATFIKGEMKSLLGAAMCLSDQEIANILNDRKISVSRRTVSKYRQQLNLPNSRIRKI
ncbi:MAG: RNA polymerase factor sigma-54 [Puniceicoccales bacterium]|nr:RNA polymerase factor sigma-54 [Puniceicoccales bacterium]